MTKTFEELKTRLAAIYDLHMARAILGWDQHTKMPPKGGEVRAEQLGTLDRFSHELFIDDEIGRLLDEVRDYEEEAGFDSNDGSLIRITRRDYEKAKRVPARVLGMPRFLSIVVGALERTSATSGGSLRVRGASIRSKSSSRLTGAIRLRRHRRDEDF